MVLSASKLKEILRLHKLWVNGDKKGKRAVLIGQDLSWSNLSWSNLSWSNLSRSNLSRSNLSRSNLSGSNLSGSDLSRSNLSWSNLSGSNLSGSNLSGSDLSRSDLSGSNLSGSNLSRSNLSWSNLSRSDLPYGLPDLYILKMQSPDLKLKAWKYLKDGKSPYQSAEYKVGKTYTVKDASTDEKQLCDRGLNVATLPWCLKDANCNALDSKVEFLEVEFTVKDIAAIPLATDGKFRVSKFKVLRKLSRDEAVKFLAKHCELMKEAS